MKIERTGGDPSILRKQAILKKQWDSLAILQKHDPNRNIAQECAMLIAEPPNEGLTVEQAKNLIKMAASEIQNEGAA